MECSWQGLISTIDNEMKQKKQAEKGEAKSSNAKAKEAKILWLTALFSLPPESGPWCLHPGLILVHNTVTSNGTPSFSEIRNTVAFFSGGIAVWCAFCACVVLVVVVLLLLLVVCVSCRTNRSHQHIFLAHI